MFGEETDGLGATQETQPVNHVLNQPLSLGDEDNDDAFVFPLDQQSSSAEPFGEPQGGEGIENQEKQKQQINGQDQILSAFDEPEKGTEKTESEDELIQKLKEKGYNIEKAEVLDEDKLFNDKLSTYNESINQTNQFLNLSDDQIVKEKIKFDYQDRYMKTGKQHLIGTEEFELEVEAEVDGYLQDSRMKKIFADNIRNEVKQNHLQKTIALKNELINERTKKIDSQIQENKRNLQHSLNQVFTQGLFGMKFEKEQIQEAFEYISSGKFSNEIKNDPNTLAELALYRLHRNKIVEKVGGPTYGEGVKAGIDSLSGKDVKQTSHISSAMQKQAGRGQSDTITRDWSNVLDPNSDEVKNAKVII